MKLRALILIVFLLEAGVALAHQGSRAFISVQQNGAQLQGRCDLDLIDLHATLNLDADEDGEVTWEELSGKFNQIDVELVENLKISADGRPVELKIREHMLDEHSGGTYLAILWQADLPNVSPAIRVEDNFFFETDPTHRALLNLNGKPAVLTAKARSFESSGSNTTQFLSEGVWHIWTGFDHILFLLALLLPAVVGERLNFAGAVREVLKVVTAFTIAHSITLSLAACGVILIPGRVVEPIIAFSVAVAALNNIWPMWRDKGWLVAFGFGLIHGFGFAGALLEVGLGGGSLAKSLLLFNLGVETGQLAIVALFIPIAFAMRESWFYRGVVLRFGSAAISLIAGFWLVERLLS